MFKKIFLIIIIFANILFASSQISLTNKEKLFIKTHPNIVLGTDKGWAPYVISHKDGSITGYDASVLKLINKVSGANFTLKLGKWGDIKQEANNRDIDGLSTAIVRKFFEKKFNFSKPYLILEKIIFTAKDNPGKFDTLDDLKGKKFGVYKSNSLDYDVAKSIPQVELIEFDSTKELIEGITTGKADAMLGNAAMFYLLNKMGNPFLKPSIFLQNKPLKLVFIIRNDFPEAISIINKSLDVIGEEKLLKLKSRWFENLNNLPSQTKSKLSFTNKEKNYINSKKQITMCVDPNGMPFEKLENEKYIGMASEYIEIFQNTINIPFKVIQTETWHQSVEFAKDKKCDILPFAMETENRKKFLNFTTPYFKTPMVLATKPNASFIADLGTIRNKKIGIVKGYASNELLKKEFPNLELVEVKNIIVGLQQVADGELFGFIDTLAMIGYMFQTKFTGELKISGKVDDKWQLGIGVRNDDLILLSILNKAIQNLSTQQTQKILNNYIGIKYEKGFDYSLFLSMGQKFCGLNLFLALSDVCRQYQN